MKEGNMSPGTTTEKLSVSQSYHLSVPDSGLSQNDHGGR